MHRTLLIVALLIGAAIELTGCGHCDCGLPYDTERASDRVEPFLIDDATTTHTLVADVTIGGSWDAWDEPDSDTPSLFITPRLESEEAYVGVDVRVRGEDDVVLAQVGLPYEDDLEYMLDAADALAGCEPGTECHVVLYVDVERVPDLGSSLVSVGGLVTVASLSENPNLSAAITLEAY